MEQRQYNSPRGTVTLTQVNPRTGATREHVFENYPLIMEEAGLDEAWAAGTMSDGSEYFTVGAIPEAWAAFDAKYPNQDAQTGEPYRRRNPLKNVSTVDFGG